MRQPSDSLYRLIKSLTMSEKIYFKKTASLHIIKGSNNYIKLFDGIQKQIAEGKYNEALLKEIFKGDAFIKNFHVAKKYLYKIILKSLRQFHSDNLISVQITNLYNEAVILYRKSLIKESYDQLNQCKELIYKDQKFEFLFQALKLERYLLSPYEKNLLLDNSKEMSEAIEKMINIKQYSELFGKFFESKDEIFLRKEIDYNRIEPFLSHPLLSDVELAVTPESKAIFNKIYFNYYLTLSDDKNSYSYIKQILKSLEENSSHKKEYIIEHIMVLKSFLDSAMFLKKYDEADEIIRKLQDIDITSPYVENTIYIIIYSFQLAKFAQTGNFEEGLKIVPEIKKRVLKLEERRELIEDKFNYGIGNLYFIAEKYEKALEYFNQILNKKESEVREDLFGFTHILVLIIHFELNNLNLLEYLVKNTNRFFSKRKKLYKVESTILEFFKKLTGLITQNELRESFKELKEKLVSITTDPFEKIAFDYFDFVSWADSKIKGHKFSDIVKSNTHV